MDLWSQLFQFDNYAELLVLVRNSIIAGAVLGLTGGLIGVFVMARDMAFAVHAISELSFAGAAAGLLFGVGVVQGSLAGSLAAALLIASPTFLKNSRLALVEIPAILPASKSASMRWNCSRSGGRRRPGAR